MTAVFLVLLFLLIALNGVFVAAEFALVRSRRAKIEQLASEGARGANLVLLELDDIDEYLSACQLGITMASIGIGFLGEPAVAKLIEPIFGSLSHGVAVAISVAIAYALVTALHVTVGEQAPKLYAIARPEGSARRLAAPLRWFRRITAPLTVGLTWIANALVRIFGVKPGELDEQPTSEDLQLLISQSATRGRLDPGEAVMLRGVFHLHEQEAREVMTPIPAVVTINHSATVSEALQLCTSSGHNRLVVVEDGNPDRVRGVVHVLRLVRLMMAEGPEAKIEAAVRDALIVPETKPLDDLLTELQRQRSSMGVVVDEYGRTVGIVTVEDILEEVVGEIEDDT
jgi:CBS domain containing-hemolysin-like protein